MKTPTKPSEKPVAIAACPSCGRRPSERIALGWTPEYQGPTTLACSDRVHALADLGPASYAFVEKMIDAADPGGDICIELPLEFVKTAEELLRGAP